MLRGLMNNSSENLDKFVDTESAVPKFSNSKLYTSESLNSEAQVDMLNDNFLSEKRPNSFLEEDETPFTSVHCNSPVHDLSDLFYPEPSGNTDVPNPILQDPECCVEKGVVGLRNLGNTCFMNAGLQSLFAHPQLTQYLLRSHQTSEDSDLSLLLQFTKLLQKVWSGQYTCITPNDFKIALGFYHSQFQDYRQHDCQEFLALLLDTLHENLNQPDVNCATKTSSNLSTTSQVISQSNTSSAGCSTSLKNNCNLTSNLVCSTAVSSASLSSLPNNVADLSVKGSVINNNISESRLLFFDNSANKCDNVIHSKSDQISMVTNDSIDHADCGARVLPSIDDLYKKDTKTLNTNVLASEFIIDEVTTDSEKFSKPENNSSRSTVENDLEELQQLLGYESSMPEAEHPDRLRNNVNLSSNVPDKFTDNAFMKKMFFEESESLDASNSIKRIKIDDSDKEKNLKTKSNCVNNQKSNKDHLLCTANQEHCCNVEVECSLKQDLCCQSKVDHSGKIKNQSTSYQPNVDVERLAHSSSIELSTSGSDIQSILEADTVWKDYTERNKSVIVENFQGQFRSTVRCSKCQHVSVTYEPFMYLSLPLPYTTEKQICVIFVSSDCRQPTKYLLEMNKTDTVSKLKQNILTVIGEESVEILIAEVLDNHISKILDDSAKIASINDSSRTIYAFEMLPMLQSSETFDKNEDTAIEEDHKTIEPLNHEKFFCDTFDTGGVLNNATPVSNRSSATNIPSDKVYKNTKTDKLTGNTIWKSSEGDDMDVEELKTDKNQDNPGCDPPSLNVWKACAICLEEMLDSDLKVHPTCHGTLCEKCLEMSFSYYRNEGVICPICSVSVEPSEDFIPLSSIAGYKPKTRILAVPIVFRNAYQCGDSEKLCIFTHPNVLYMPSQLTCDCLYDMIDRLVPSTSSTYKIHFTGGEGLRCSRCDYTTHCTGCEINHDSTVINLLPSDCLAVQFFNLTNEQLEMATNVTNDASMEKLRPHGLTLYDCFRAFAESEQLDENNPWYCPMCQKNQCATKKMTVWRYPQTLVVHLKRFVFHELSSNKIDNKVEFPLENLQLSEYIYGPKTSDLIYNLQSCVCHFGGSNSGHYTAYSLNPSTSKWHYYNDETVTERQPIDEDYTSAYILFYKLRGADQSFTLPKTQITENPVEPTTSLSTAPVDPKTICVLLEEVEKTKKDNTSPRDNDEDFYD